MTPAQEKAKELVEKYKPYVYPYIGSSFMTGDEFPEQILRYAKQCALISVDGMREIVSTMPSDIGIHYTTYLDELTTEIEKI